MSNKKSFYDIAKKLEGADENKWYLVWIRCGAFFVAIESSAIILSEELNLKRTYLKPGVCKVGFPVASLFDYVKKLENIGISFVIYNYSKDEMVENGERYVESSEEITQFKAFFNEWFLRDTSKKIKNGKKTRAKEGKVMTMYLTYRV